MAGIAYIMVGLSGSGKSTQAKELAGENGVICSTDDQFMVDGVYKFDPSKLGENHAKNLAKFEQAMKDGVPVVVCDNTNLRQEHRQQYMDVADRYDYEAIVRLVGNPHDPEHQALCASRNVHGLTLEMIRRQAKNFDLIPPQISDKVAG